MTPEQEKLRDALLAVGDAQALLGEICAGGANWPAEHQILGGQALLRLQESAWWLSALAMNRGLDLRPSAPITPLRAV